MPLLKYLKGIAEIGVLGFCLTLLRKDSGFANLRNLKNKLNLKITDNKKAQVLNA